MELACIKTNADLEASSLYLLSVTSAWCVGLDSPKMCLNACIRFSTGSGFLLYYIHLFPRFGVLGALPTDGGVLVVAYTGAITWVEDPLRCRFSLQYQGKVTGVRILGQKHLPLCYLSTKSWLSILRRSSSSYHQTRVTPARVLRQCQNPRGFMHANYYCSLRASAQLKWTVCSPFRSSYG
jgi:hypothetical protein